MAGENDPRTPFDEQAALEHLDRLKHDLEQSRKRRKDASAAFDEFVGSFRKGPQDQKQAASRTETRTLSTRYDTAPPPSTQPHGRRKPLPMAGILAGGAIAVAAGVLLTRAWRVNPSEPAPNSPATIQTPAPAGSGAASEATPAASDDQTVPVGALTELIAVRDVWVRATVDGARVVERELEAGARVPLRGRTIVIRAGNAGAVRIVIDGQDRGTLGADGVVVTRTFTASTGPGR